MRGFIQLHALYTLEDKIQLIPNLGPVWCNSTNVQKEEYSKTLYGVSK